MNRAMLLGLLPAALFGYGSGPDYGCAGVPGVLKVAPPLVASEEHVDTFVAAIHAVTEAMHGSAAFWAEPPGLARRVMNL